MKNIILSIKNKYAAKILSGDKLYEFRGWIWKEQVRYVYIYSSGVTKQIVARFEVTSIDCDTPLNIWQKYQNYTGVTKEEFFKYVDSFNYDKIYSVKVDNLEILEEDKYINLDLLKLKNAPQRFKYLNSDENKVLERYFSE
jgi:predicted transcriptional regulator